MHAIEVENEQLYWRETTSSSPAAGEVLINVRASAVNRADLLQVRGLYPVPPGASPSALAPLPPQRTIRWCTSPGTTRSPTRTTPL